MSTFTLAQMAHWKAGHSMYSLSLSSHPIFHALISLSPQIKFLSPKLGSTYYSLCQPHLSYLSSHPYSASEQYFNLNEMFFHIVLKIE